MDEIADLELSLAEQIAVLFADQQARQGQQVILGLRTQPCDEFLCLGFQFGGEWLLKRHGALLAGKSKLPTDDRSAVLCTEVPPTLQLLTLASVRDKAALDKLPEDERQQWRQLWDDVAALLKKVAEK